MNGDYDHDMALGQTAETAHPVASAKVISQGPSLAFFDKDANQNAAAWEFYKFLTNPTNTAALAAAKSYFPVRAAAYNIDSVKAYTAAATAGVTAESARTDKVKAYTGQCFALNTTYTTNKSYYTSDVFDLSASARTAIGKAVTTIFNNDKVTSDAQITEAVTIALQNAYNTVTQ